MNADIAKWDGRFHGELSTHPSPHFRPHEETPGARDRDVWQGCFVENEYLLGALKPEDAVVDIGMHIGSFCCLASVRGSQRIYGYEANPKAYEYACKNVAEFGPGIHAHHAAVVRSDDKRSAAYFSDGGMGIFVDEGHQVAGISLDQIIHNIGRIRFLKIDCEGGEWPILYTCTKLDQVQEIAGEYHAKRAGGDTASAQYKVGAGLGHPELDDLPFACTPEALAKFLSEKGFYVQYTPENDGGTGNFFATREVPK